MMQFAEQFPDFGIVSPLTTQLRWSHVVEVLALKTPEARLFYLGEAATRQLGKRELRRTLPVATACISVRVPTLSGLTDGSMSKRISRHSSESKPFNPDLFCQLQPTYRFAGSHQIHVPACATHELVTASPRI
jgi:hypothetical protein